MKKKAAIRIIIPLLTVLLVLVVYLTGVLAQLSDRLNDAIYQRGDITDGTISIIEIDEHSLEELGPYQNWTRDYVAEAIELLNADSELAPAAIGVDILYIGNSNEASDSHLVEATALINNVVYGSYLNFDIDLVEKNDTYVMEQVISLYEEPFEELQECSEVGFVNGFADEDGVVRHAMQSIVLNDGRTVPSFAYAIYQKYASKCGGESKLSIPLNAKDYFYIDYTGHPEDYSNSFSLSDFIQGEIPVEYFTDGIVLIGPYAEGMMDSYVAAIDHQNPMYGVEIHANIVEQMLKGSFKKECGRAVMAIILAIITLLAVFVCYLGKLRYSFLYTACCVILYPAICMLLYAKGILIDVIFVPIVALVVMIVNIAVHYLKASADKKRVERTFKRYVAPEIIDEITKTGMDTIKLGGEAVECAILFVDIRGFTTMSEALEPEEVVSILNQYLGLTSGSIFKFGGTLDKFIGDATMAIFGAPLPMDDYIFKAVCAAWDMVQSSEALAKELMEKYGRAVSFGVGVHCGKAVVGNIGTERRMDYTAIGDTVNTSARLEANAPKDTVYISRKVYDALEGRITAESIGNLPLKGKSEQLEVFKLTGIIG